MMAEDWNDCTKNDIEMHEAINKAKTSNRITNVIMIIHTVAVLLYGDLILAKVDVTDRTINLPHIYKIEVPFSINTQRTYKVVLIVELIHLLVCSWGMGTLNALLLTLAFSSPNATEKIVKAISYYSVTNIKAFIFCYAGEYLNNKISDNYDDLDEGFL
ncbi:hypothetical protein EAG_12884 [Camponotus floridanus]|uniref:Uncharacterized protein n=1 Tax=Camponotus floridanus TaxID=104421 RepID=E2ATR2_CAMFO|nr:hypothetical protein EAG_12884 [Camponotus floridanus]